MNKQVAPVGKQETKNANLRTHIIDLRKDCSEIARLISSIQFCIDEGAILPDMDKLGVPPQNERSIAIDASFIFDAFMRMYVHEAVREKEKRDA